MTLDYNKIIESLYNNFGLPDEIDECKTRLLVRFSNFFVTITIDGRYEWGDWYKSDGGIKCSGLYCNFYHLRINKGVGSSNGIVYSRDFSDIPKLMETINAIPEILR